MPLERISKRRKKKRRTYRRRNRRKTITKDRRRRTTLNRRKKKRKSGVKKLTWRNRKRYNTVIRRRSRRVRNTKRRLRKHKLKGGMEAAAADAPADAPAAAVAKVGEAPDSGKKRQAEPSTDLSTKVVKYRTDTKHTYLIDYREIPSSGLEEIVCCFFDDLIMGYHLQCGVDSSIRSELLNKVLCFQPETGMNERDVKSKYFDGHITIKNSGLRTEDFQWILDNLDSGLSKCNTFIFDWDETLFCGGFDIFFNKKTQGLIHGEGDHDMAMNIFNVLFQGFDESSRSEKLHELLVSIDGKAREIIILTANTIGLDDKKKETIIKLFQKCGIPITIIHSGCGRQSCEGCEPKFKVIMDRCC